MFDIEHATVNIVKIDNSLKTRVNYFEIEHKTVRTSVERQTDRQNDSTNTFHNV